MSIELDVTDLATNKVNAPSLPMNDIIHSCGFRLLGDFAGRLWVKYAIILSPCLKYGYVTGENELPHLLTRALQVWSSNVPGIR